MEESTIIVGIPPGKLEDMIAGAVLTGLRVYHNGKERAADPSPEELLSRQDAAVLLGVTLPTLGAYTRKGYLIGYRIGTRVRYKRNELLDGLKRMRYAKTARP